MAIKTFTTGEVLTASDTNTFLANAGLVYVAGGTFSNVGSFDMTGFSSTYDFYQFQINVTRHTTNGSLTGVLYQGATPRNTSYYGSLWASGYTGTSGIYATRNNGANLYFGDYGSYPTFIAGTISGISNQKFNMVFQTVDNVLVQNVVGSMSNYAGTNDFNMIRISGNTNISGSWALMGVRKP